MFNIYKHKLNIVEAKLIKKDQQRLIKRIEHIKGRASNLIGERSIGTKLPKIKEVSRARSQNNSIIKVLKTQEDKALLRRLIDTIDGKRSNVYLITHR